MIYEEKTIETIPVGPLGLIPLKSCSALGAKVNDYAPSHIQSLMSLVWHSAWHVPSY